VVRMQVGKVQTGMTRSSSRIQESPLPTENWENVSPKPFGQPSLCSRHFLEFSLALKETSCHSLQQPHRDSIATTRFTPDTHSISAKSILAQDFCNMALILPCPSVPSHIHLHI